MEADFVAGTILTPPTFFTPRVLVTCRGAAKIGVAPELFNQAVEILTIAERDLFVPFLQESTPASFGQQFEYLAYRYAPIRSCALSLLKGAVGEDFLSRDFEPAFREKNWLVQHASGKSKSELDILVGQYVETAQLLVNSPAALIATVPGEHLVHIISPIAEADFGLTALAFVFEGSIDAKDWVVTETFTRTKRAVLDYEDAAKRMTAEAGLEATLAYLRSDDDEPRKYSASDLRHTFFRYPVPRSK